MSWFRTRELCSGVWMLAEPLHVNSWMVGGSERAVLLDTGCGIAPIRPVAESLTSLPLSVVNTHYHSDHTGGNHEFDEIVTHQLTAPLIELPVLRESLDGFLQHVRRLEDARAAIARSTASSSTCSTSTPIRCRSRTTSTRPPGTSCRRARPARSSTATASSSATAR